MRAKQGRQWPAARESWLARGQAAGVLIGLDGGHIAADGHGLTGQPALAKFDDVVHRDGGQPLHLHQGPVHPDNPGGGSGHGVHSSRTPEPSASTARSASRGSEQSTTTPPDCATTPPSGETVIFASGPAASRAILVSRSSSWE